MRSFCPLVDIRGKDIALPVECQGEPDTIPKVRYELPERRLNEAPIRDLIGSVNTAALLVIYPSSAKQPQTSSNRTSGEPARS
jgi:hypothetical protein